MRSLLLFIDRYRGIERRESMRRVLVSVHGHRLQGGHAGSRQLHRLLDEVVLHATDRRRLERSYPVDAALADGGLHRTAAWSWRRREIHVLDVDREESPGVLREVVGGHEPLGDRGHLELELHQRG